MDNKIGPDIKIDKSPIFFFLLSLVICIEAYKLGLGSLNAPKPGFFPFITGMLLGALSLLRFAVTLMPRNKAQGFKISINWKKSISLLAALLAYAFLMNHLGYFVSTFILIVFLLKVIEPKPWWTAFAGGLGIAFFTHVIFRIWLQVQLPRGFLGF